MYTPRPAHSTYAAMSARQREFNDFIMNPLNWIGVGFARSLLIRASSTRLGGLIRYSGNIKRPVHSVLAMEFPFLHRAGSKVVLQQLLRARIRTNQLLFGIGMIHPLDTLNYVRKGEYGKAWANYHLPFLGVPLFEHLTERGSGAPSGDIPTAPSPPPPSVSVGPVIQQHRRQERPR
jgi:hypothetical protein